jgi:hypothetical protein
MKQNISLVEKKIISYMKMVKETQREIQIIIMEVLNISSMKKQALLLHL